MKKINEKLRKKIFKKKTLTLEVKELELLIKNYNDLLEIGDNNLVKTRC